MAFEGTSFNSNFPLSSVVVSLVVPGITIFAKYSGSLFSSNTVPETVIVLVDEVLFGLLTAGSVLEDVDVFACACAAWDEDVFFSLSFCQYSILLPYKESLKVLFAFSGM